MKRQLAILLLGVWAGLGLWAAPPLYGQASSSTALTGTITDSTGAVVPGVALTAVQTATHVAYKGQTNATGNYTIPFIAPGTYTITASHAGFTKAVHTNITVLNNQTVRADFKLTVGQESNTVTVTATPPPIDTESATLSDTATGAAISQLPITDHDPLKLANTVPGVTLTGDNPNGNPPGERFSGPGERQIQNQVTLDGVALTNTLYGTVNFRPSQAAVQELTVQTGTYSAQYGGYLGVHVNAVSKAGGNSLHGTFSEALRNQSLDSRSVGEPVTAAKNPLHYNQFAAELDGPVVLPGYNGKNKTFFMFSYEGLRNTNDSTSAGTVLTDAERTGDFSALTGKTLTDPSDPSCLIGNVIQATDASGNACIDPHATELLNFMPKANQPGVVSTNSSGVSSITDNISAATPNRNNFNQYLTRVDEVLTDNARLFVRYGYQKTNPANFAIFEPDSVFSPSTQSNFVVGETQIFSPSLVNQIQLGRNNFNVDTVNAYYLNPSLQTQLNQITIPGFAFPAGNPGEPLISINGYDSIGNGGTNWFQGDDIWTVNDTLNYTHGAHNIIIGADLGRYVTTRKATNNPQGFFDFPASYTGAGSAKAGDGAADFMLGLSDQSISPTDELQAAGMQWRDGFFALDKWNVTRNLTLNLGLRYELPTVARVPSGNGNTLSPNWRNLVPIDANGTVYSNPGSYPLYLPNHRQFAPRVGFAYRVGNGWVARGGYGIYYNPNQTNSYTLLVENEPFENLTEYDSPTFTSGTPYTAAGQVTLSNPAPGAAVGANPHPNVVNIPPAFPSATMSQWSFDVERTLWAGAGLDVQYLGSHTDHLDTSWYNNQPHARFSGSGAMPTGAIACPAGSATAGSANYDAECDTSLPLQARRPYTAVANALNANNPGCNDPTSPGYNAYAPGCVLAWGSVRTIDNMAYSNYDAMNIVLTQRMTHGISLHFAYTWSHDLDQGQDSNDGGQPMDPYNWQLDYGNSSLDLRQRLVGTYIWEMPFFQDSSISFVRDVVAGWDLSGVVTVQTGAPMNITLGSSDPAGTGRGGHERPMLLSTPSASSCGTVLKGCLNAADFGQPAAGTYGDTSPNLLYGPGMWNFDTALAKRFRLGERTNLQIRGEAFNTFNHINWGNPNTNSTSGSFGNIGQTSARAMRVVELSLRLAF